MRRFLIAATALLAALACSSTAASGASSPIVVVTSPGFSSYVPEVMRAEGLNGFATADVTDVDAELLAGFDVAVLGDVAVTAEQAEALAGWVEAGGNLIALSPDEQLAGLLGITTAGGTLDDAYVKVDTATAPGKGIVGETIQYHGSADLYDLDGATAVATLYSDSATATDHPAVTLHDAGAGQAAAFMFDLARSTVLTRQGNPAWSGQDRDLFDPAGLIRPNDLFFGGTAPNWVDLEKINIPQADELQRLLVNVITEMNRDRTPVPRFWYLPRGESAAVVMTGDDHANGGTAGRFNRYKALSPAGCSVARWECVRSTSYTYVPNSDLPAGLANQFDAEGFEIALHPTRGGCTNPTLGQFNTTYTNGLAAFATAYPELAAPATSRFHCTPWPDWSTHAKVEVAHGIRLDTNYYHFPDAWGGFPGFMTGSGELMRFAELDGSVIDLYQAPTHVNDEAMDEGLGQVGDAIDSMLDAATGPEGYYGMFTANMHTDDAVSAGSEAIVASAQAHGVPVVSARQALEWVEGRDASSFADFSWSDGDLGFTVTAGADGLQGMLPADSTRGVLARLTRDGSPVALTARTVKGVDYALFDAKAGSYEAAYEPPPVPVPGSGPGTPGPSGGTSGTGAPDGPNTSGGGAGAAPDRAAPRLTIRVGSRRTAKGLLRGGLGYRLTCSESCRLRSTLVAKTAGVSHLVGRASTRLPAAHSVRLAIKIRSKAARRLLRSGRVRLVLRVTATDAAGNARTIVRRIKVVR